MRHSFRKSKRPCATARASPNSSLFRSPTRMS
jgi:hypothetical protein